MITKTKKSKKLNKFTEEKNNQPPVEVKEVKRIGEVDLPETTVMVPVKSFAMPLATVAQVKEAMERYQEFNKALLTEKDLYEVVDKKTGEKKIIAKKSGFAKIGRFWGVSTEILRSFTEEKEVLKDKWGYNAKAGKSYLIAKKGDKYLLAKAWAKAILPNGQFAVRGAAMAETERNFAHLDHDLLATSETRAVKRAVEAVVGMGEITTEEEYKEEETEQPARNLRRNETLNTKTGRIERQTSDPNVKEVGIDPNEIIPMYQSPVCKLSSPKLPASEKQKDFIFNLLTDKGIDLASDKPIVFTLGRRPNLRKVGLEKFTKLDAWDLICAIKKGDLDKVFTKEEER